MTKEKWGSEFRWVTDNYINLPGRGRPAAHSGGIQLAANITAMARQGWVLVKVDLTQCVALLEKRVKYEVEEKEE